MYYCEPVLIQRHRDAANSQSVAVMTGAFGSFPPLNTYTHGHVDYSLRGSTYTQEFSLGYTLRNSEAAFIISSSYIKHVF